MGAMSLVEITPSKGKRMTGSREVMGRGRTSPVLKLNFFDLHKKIYSIVLFLSSFWTQKVFFPFFSNYLGVLESI